jgi:hypothetical protein
VRRARRATHIRADRPIYHDWRARMRGCFQSKYAAIVTLAAPPANQIATSDSTDRIGAANACTAPCRRKLTSK